MSHVTQSDHDDRTAANITGSSSNHLRITGTQALPQLSRKAVILVAVIVLAFTLVLPASLIHASPTTYYTSMSGSDSGAGTQTQPFRTIAKGVSVLRAGDTLLVRAGTYAEEIQNIPSGTSWSAPVTVKAYPGETVTVKPDSGAERVVEFSAYNNQQFIIVDGFILDGTNVGYDAVKFEENTASGVAHDIRILNSEIRNAPQQGILTNDDTNNLYFGNLNIHDNGTTDFHHGIYVKNSGTVIENSKIYRNAGWGVHLYGGTDNNNIVRNNMIYNNARIGGRGAGVGVYTGSGNQIYNNALYGNKSGIELNYGANSSGIYNNTIYNNSSYGILVGADASSTTIRNNIVSGSGTLLENDGPGTQSDHNLMGTDAKFVNASAADFELNAGSPAIDTGMTVSSVPMDMEGVSRPQGGAYDLGACEYQGSAPAPTATKVPSTPTTIPPTNTPLPPTATKVPPTATKAASTVTTIPPTNTLLPSTVTKVPPTATKVAPTATQPASSGTGSGTGLTGQYYDNNNFTTLKVTRTDPTINFQWWNKSPDASMGADTFSARWTGEVQPMYTQTYTFYTNSDDGARLWVNGQLVVDSWGPHPPTEASGAISLTAGSKYSIKLEYHEEGGDATMILLWSSQSQAKQVIPQSQLYPGAVTNPTVTVVAPTATKVPATVVVPTATGIAPTATRVPATVVAPTATKVPPTPTQPVSSGTGNGTGLTGQYYDNSDFTTLKITRTDPTLNFQWWSKSPDASIGTETFSARWTGQIQPLYTQTYVFYINCDDGARLWINGQTVVDFWGPHGPSEASGAIDLVAGTKYDIKVEYHEDYGDATMILMWSSQSQAKQVIPQSQLYPSGATTAAQPAVVAPSNTTGSQNTNLTAAQPAAPTNTAVPQTTTDTQNTNTTPVPLGVVGQPSGGGEVTPVPIPLATH